jgi:hypothetical protein
MSVARCVPSATISYTILNSILNRPPRSCAISCNMKIFETTRISKLLLITLLNLPNSALQQSFLGAQCSYISATHYGQSVNDRVFQHTHLDPAKSQRDQQYVGHFSREIVACQGGSPNVRLQDCFLRLFQAEINSLDRKHVTPQLVYGRLSPYIPEPDRSKITFAVCQHAMDKENPWIDPSLRDQVVMIHNRWKYLKSPELDMNTYPRTRTERKGPYTFHWASKLADVSITESQLEIPYVDESNMIFMPDELLSEFLGEFQYHLNQALPKTVFKGHDLARLELLPWYKDIFQNLGGVHLDDLDMYWNWIKALNKRGRNSWDRLPLGRKLMEIEVSIRRVDTYLKRTVPKHSMTSRSLTRLDSDLLPPGAESDDPGVPGFSITSGAESDDPGVPGFSITSGAELDDPDVPGFSITSGAESDNPYVPEFSITAGDEFHDTSFPASTAGNIMFSEDTQFSSSSATTSTVTTLWDPSRRHQKTSEPIEYLWVESR